MSAPASPPPKTPESSPVSSAFVGHPLSSAKSSCVCGSAVPPLVGSLSANTLADSLGVSPLYKQQDSARWNTAAQVYKTSRTVSPTALSPNPSEKEIKKSDAYPSPNKLTFTLAPTQQTPLSLEDIAANNRRRHAEQGGILPRGEGGPLELEAIAAVHELANEVHSISVSEMLPRTSDLIFVNVKTQEGHPFTLELTMKGWRVASLHSDCMNGDYTKVDLHTRYFENARQLLNVISPDHTTRFNESLAEKLKLLEVSNGVLAQ